MQLCPLHGPLTAHGIRCPHEDCDLPLLRLDGSAEAPQAWKWESCAGQPEVNSPKPPEVSLSKPPEVRTTSGMGRRYGREIAALAGEGYSDAEIVAWFKPLGVTLATAEVAAALVVSHAR